MNKNFKIKGQSVVITGGAGLLGSMHAEAIAEIGGIPILFDSNFNTAKKISEKIKKNYSTKCFSFKGDVTREKDIKNLVKFMIKKKLKFYGLINNVASNSAINKINKNDLEKFSLKNWNSEINVGLTSSFLCSKIIGKKMVKNKKGVIINISSDLGIISPDQRLYKNSFKKPVTYSVVKHGIIGLTKYLATYWAKEGLRANCLCPGGVHDNQDETFVNKIEKLIPMGRMANVSEYKGAIQFMISNASSYMNGATLIIDGGRTIW